MESTRIFARNIKLKSNSIEWLSKCSRRSKNRIEIHVYVKTMPNRIWRFENLPVIGCVGISAPLIPCVSNKLFTFVQLLSGFAAAASAPFTSFGVVDDRAKFCAAAIVIACIANEMNTTITASRLDCRTVSNIFDRFLLDHIVCRLQFIYTLTNY